VRAFGARSVGATRSCGEHVPEVSDLEPATGQRDDDLAVALQHLPQEGRVLSPSDLSVGAHTLRLQSSDSSCVIFDNTITFYVDAAGTGVCL